MLADHVVVRDGRSRPKIHILVSMHVGKFLVARDLLDAQLKVQYGGPPIAMFNLGTSST